MGRQRERETETESIFLQLHAAVRERYRDRETERVRHSQIIIFMLKASLKPEIFSLPYYVKPIMQAIIPLGLLLGPRFAWKERMRMRGF